MVLKVHPVVDTEYLFKFADAVAAIILSCKVFFTQLRECSCWSSIQLTKVSHKPSSVEAFTSLVGDLHESIADSDKLIFANISG